MLKAIIDSDWGGDVLQLASVLMSRPSEYEVVGATVTFGNAPLAQNLENAGAILRLLGREDSVPRYAGAAAPDGCELPPEGDEAHGSTGMGGVVLEASSVPPAPGDAVTFLLDTLASEPEGSVLLVATGPLTNVARAIRREPLTMKRLRGIRIMGGCVRAMAGFRVDEGLNRVGGQSIQRKGNITEWAEFNFQQAPEDARAVLESGIPIALFPMDCTHQLCFSDERAERMRRSGIGSGETVERLIELFKAPWRIDAAKFGIPPVMHDVNTVVSLVRPDLYEGESGTVRINVEGPRAGETFFLPDAAGPHWVASRIRDADAAFSVLLEALAATVQA